MKKILFLGAAPTQIPPLRYALEQGHYVITCDYLPENPGHILAHESYNISTTDKNAVLNLARRLNIDAIIAYASDPAAPTAAYVAEKMGLPGNPYQSVLTLARKDLFRKFLKNNGFNVPRSESFYEFEKARTWLKEIDVPAFIKPVDSSGSKGITYLTDIFKFEEAFDNALAYSREKMVVVEEAVQRVGYQVDSDIFFLNGQLFYWIWGDQHQNKKCNPFAPIGISFPSVLDEQKQKIAIDKVASVIKKLNFNFGAFNVEFIVDKFGEIWIIEIGPRNGGNLIPEVIKYVGGFDFVKHTVDVALGAKSIDYSENQENNYCASYLIHAEDSGIFDYLWLSENIKKYIITNDTWVKNGDGVKKYTVSNDTLGAIILKFSSMDEMLKTLNSMEAHIRVILR